MKKRILMITLVLMIVLSSFVVSSANSISPISLTLTPQAHEQFNKAVNNLSVNYDTIVAFQLGDSNTIEISAFNKNSVPQYLHLVEQSGKYYITNDDLLLQSFAYSTVYIDSTTNVDPPIYTSSKNIGVSTLKLFYTNQYIYDETYISKSITGNIIYDPTPPLNVYVKIKAGQQLNLVYDNSVRNKVLKSVDTTDNVMLNFWVSKDGAPSTLSAGQVVDSWWNRIDINSIPYMPELAEGEMYSIGLFGKSNVSPSWLSWTESPINQEATFEIDITKCQYSVTSTMTGLPIDAGTIDTETTGPPATSNKIPGLVDMDEVKDGIHRSDYQEGIVGDIEYQFDRLISFIKLPFTILLSFFVNLGDIIQYALGSVGALTGSLKSLYGILPASIAYLMTFAITITIFKLIFGR